MSGGPICDRDLAHFCNKMSRGSKLSKKSNLSLHFTLDQINFIRECNCSS